MDMRFKSEGELFKRIKPALEAKRIELDRLGFPNIKNEEIFNYLKNTKWKIEKDLMLSDVVSDILHADNKKISSYLRIKKTRRGRSEENEKRRKETSKK